MADKLMYIPNDDTQNYPFYRLLLMVETFKLINQPIKILLKSLNRFSQRIRKRHYKLWGLV